MNAVVSGVVAFARSSVPEATNFRQSKSSVQRKSVINQNWRACFTDVIFYLGALSRAVPNCMCLTYNYGTAFLLYIGCEVI
jgi:hypothetical protein